MLIEAQKRLLLVCNIDMIPLAVDWSICYQLIIPIGEIGHTIYMVLKKPKPLLVKSLDWFSSCTLFKLHRPIRRRISVVFSGITQWLKWRAIMSSMKYLDLPWRGRIFRVFVQLYRWKELLILIPETIGRSSKHIFTTQLKDIDL